MTLANWVVWYDCSKKHVKQTNEEDKDGLPVETFTGDNQNDDEHSN